mmetsp:Transcript_24082/g.32928  ORF Transcript_24082/g.32928 Transcript_24082/m.32928 type:complete len:190 (-) Transcript_24082:20-589(-)
MWGMMMMIGIGLGFVVSDSFPELADLRMWLALECLFLRLTQNDDNRKYHNLYRIYLYYGNPRGFSKWFSDPIIYPSTTDTTNTHFNMDILNQLETTDIHRYYQLFHQQTLDHLLLNTHFILTTVDTLPITVRIQFQLHKTITTAAPPTPFLAKHGTHLSSRTTSPRTPCVTTSPTTKSKPEYPCLKHIP